MKEPIWGDTVGRVTGFMCKTDFELELGTVPARVYPCAESLAKANPSVEKCGIVRVSVSKAAEHKVAGRKYAFMYSVAFYLELGGARQGTVAYSSIEECEKNESFSKRNGIVPVEIVLQEIIRETIVGKTEEPKVITTTHLHLLALEIVNGMADLIRAWIKQFNNQRLDVPPEVQPQSLLMLCERLAKNTEIADYPMTKLHRWIGHVGGCLMATRVATKEQLKKIMDDSRHLFGEEPDEELMAHLDPANPFKIDIGGE